MKVVKLAILSAVLLVISAFAAEKDLKLLDKIDIVVNGEPVLHSEVKLAKYWFGVSSRKKAAKKLVEQILLAQEAKRAGLSVSPYEVKAAIKEIAQRNGYGSVEDFKKALEQQGIAFNEFKNLVKRELLTAKYIQYVLKPKVLKNSLEAIEETFRDVYILYLSKDDEGFPDKYAYVKTHLNLKNFQKLAKLYSDDPITKKTGGYVGNVKKGELVSFLDKAIWKAKPGEIIELDRPNGVYFIYIKSQERKMIPKSIPPRELQRKLKSALDLKLAKLKEKAVVKYIDKSLEP